MSLIPLFELASKPEHISVFKLLLPSIDVTGQERDIILAAHSDARKYLVADNRFALYWVVAAEHVCDLHQDTAKVYRLLQIAGAAPTTKCLLYVAQGFTISDSQLFCEMVSAASHTTRDETFVALCKFPTSNRIDTRLLDMIRHNRFDPRSHYAELDAYIQRSEKRPAGVLIEHYNKKQIVLGGSIQTAPPKILNKPEPEPERSDLAMMQKTIDNLKTQHDADMCELRLELSYLKTQMLALTDIIKKFKEI